jgi:hypothetical protein
MGAVFFDAVMSDDERRGRLYSGDVFIYSPTPGTLALTGLAQQMLEKAFDPIDPRRIQEHLSPEEVAEALATLKPKFIHHPECKRIIPNIMQEMGVVADCVYFDVPRMRSAYPSNFLSAGIAYAFHPHRDTWYSAPMCQLNWWMPIYPVHPDNAMGFYPRYFHERIKNNSDAYNYYKWNAKNRASAAQHVKNDAREQPKAQQPLENVTVRYLPPPGGVVLFSGAQLHETVPNTTSLARYSVDFRTVHLEDARSGRGAPNLDSRCTGTTMRDYLSARDLSRLPKEIIESYDDGTAASEGVLYFGDRLAHR